MQLLESDGTMCCIRRLFVAVAMVIVLNLVSGDSSNTSECSETPESALAILKKKLFCNYDSEEIPLNQTSNTVEILYLFYPVSFQLYDHENALRLWGFARMYWKDLRLVWNRADYGELEELEVRMKDIWVPDIDIDTNTFQPSYLPTHPCDLSEKGVVLCTLYVEYWANCIPDVHKWPFDSVNCSVSIASKTDQVTFNQTKQYGARGVYYTSDMVWKMVAFSQLYKPPNDTSLMKWPTCVFSYIFKRHSQFIIATIFIPSIVMLIATGSTFCLDPEGAARMFIIGANMICHCLFLMYLSWYVPANGDRTPVIVTFFSDSFILVEVSVIITVCAGKMRAAARAPPAWVTSIADGVQDSPVQYLLFNGLYTKSNAEDEEESDTVASVMASSTSNKWRRIATLLDRISLLVFAIIIAVLSCSFIP